MCNCKSILEKKYAEKYKRDGVEAITSFDYYNRGIMTIKPYIKRTWRTYGVGLSEKPKDGYALRPTLEGILFNYCPICGEKLR